MFSFKLPVGAVLSVSLPTGGGAAFAHVGDGRFVSSVPPIILQGLRPEGQGGEDMLPVEWDAKSMPVDTVMEPVQFGFDPQTAAAAVEAAAAGGDVRAGHIVSMLKAAEEMIAARAALTAATQPEGQPQAEGVSDPVDSAAAEGVGSGA